VDAAVAALVALVAFDAGVYADAYRGTKGDLERVAEPVALLATAVGIAIALIMPGRAAGVAVLTLLGGRAVFDTLHLGDGNVLAINLPKDWALYAMVVKISAGAVFALFAFPA
jgi:hypothetical protein